MRSQNCLVTEHTDKSSDNTRTEHNVFISMFSTLSITYIHNIHTHIHTHACTHTYAHTRTHTHTHIYTHIHTHIHTRMHDAHAYTYKHTHTYTATPPPPSPHTQSFQIYYKQNIVDIWIGEVGVGWGQQHCQFQWQTMGAGCICTPMFLSTWKQRNRGKKKSRHDDEHKRNKKRHRLTDRENERCGRKKKNKLTNLRLRTLLTASFFHDTHYFNVGLPHAHCEWRYAHKCVCLYVCVCVCVCVYA